MRFQNTANGPNISDGPHRIEQTATWPGQVLLTVPAFDAAKTIVVEPQPLVPEVPTARQLLNLPERDAVPPPLADKG
jgi:hypothetical protein